MKNKTVFNLCQICNNSTEHRIKYKFSEEYREQTLLVCDTCKENLDNGEYD